MCDNANTGGNQPDGNQIKIMKVIKLSVKEISELQPTTVANVRNYRTVVGGLELSGELDMDEVEALVTRHFGEDCAAWEGEADDGDDCVHVTVYAKLCGCRSMTERGE